MALNSLSLTGINGQLLCKVCHCILPNDHSAARHIATPEHQSAHGQSLNKGKRRLESESESESGSESISQSDLLPDQSSPNHLPHTDLDEELKRFNGFISSETPAEQQIDLDTSDSDSDESNLSPPLDLLNVDCIKSAVQQTYHPKTTHTDSSIGSDSEWNCL